MPLNTTRILVSNDDGISAPGIAILEKIARQFSDDVWVIAPEGEQSGAGHSLTLTKPLRIRKLAEKRYSVSGTPTDCVMMAVNEVMRDNPPTLVLSGVNRGGNLAEDITYSGTVSVAMEATLANIKAIAFSQCIRPPAKTKWQTSEKYLPIVLEKLIAQDWEDGVFLNVNFPAFEPEDVTGIHITEQGRRQIMGNNVDKRTDPRGYDYYWFGLGRELGVPGVETDLSAVGNKAISITPLHLEMTHKSTRQALINSLQEDF